jgi:hypothetical protein
VARLSCAPSAALRDDSLLPAPPRARLAPQALTQRHQRTLALAVQVIAILQPQPPPALAMQATDNPAAAPPSLAPYA